VREAANRANCQSNLKNLGVAIHNWSNSRGNDAPLPWNGTQTITGSATGITATVQSSIFFQILPQIEQDNISQNFTQASNTTVKVYSCPSDSSSATAASFSFSGTGAPTAGQSYAGAGGSYQSNRFLFGKGASAPLAYLSRSFTDGTSNTVMLTEKVQKCAETNAYSNRWALGDESSFAPTSGMTMKTGATPTKNCGAPTAAADTIISAAHPGSVQLLMGDGAVRVCPQGYPMTGTGTTASFYTLCTPNAGDAYQDF